MSGEGFTTETNASFKIALINELITGPPADYMLERSGIYNDARQIRVLDNATGMGNLAFRFIEGEKTRGRDLNSVSVTAADIDGNYVEWLRTRAIKSDYQIECMQFNQQSTGMEQGSFTHVFNNFGIFFAQNDMAALEETSRVLRSGGVAFFSSWNTMAWWDEVVEGAMARYLPNAPPLSNPLDMFRMLGWAEGDQSEKKLRLAGYVNVQSDVFSFTPDIAPEDFAVAGAHLVKAMASKTWDEATKMQFGPGIEGALYQHLVSTWEGGRWPGKISALLTWGKKP